MILSWSFIPVAIEILSEEEGRELLLIHVLVDELPLGVKGVRFESTEILEMHEEGNHSTWWASLSEGFQDLFRNGLNFIFPEDFPLSRRKVPELGFAKHVLNSLWDPETRLHLGHVIVKP